MEEEWEFAYSLLLFFNSWW